MKGFRGHYVTKPNMNMSIKQQVLEFVKTARTDKEVGLKPFCAVFYVL